MDGYLVLIPIMISIGFFALVAVIALATASTRKNRARLQAEVQNKLIDKFGTAPEFVAFLSSPAGKNFVGTFEAQPRIQAHHRILKGIRTATVLCCLGAGFCVLAATEDHGFIIPGLILLALGGGYILSSFLTVRLSKEWGLLDPPSTDARGRDWNGGPYPAPSAPSAVDAPGASPYDASRQ